MQIDPLTLHPPDLPPNQCCPHPAGHLEVQRLLDHEQLERLPQVLSVIHLELPVIPSVREMVNATHTATQDAGIHCSALTSTVSLMISFPKLLMR